MNKFILGLLVACLFSRLARANDFEIKNCQPIFTSVTPDPNQNFFSKLFGIQYTYSVSTGSSPFELKDKNGSPFKLQNDWFIDNKSLVQTLSNTYLVLFAKKDQALLEPLRRLYIFDQEGRQISMVDAGSEGSSLGDFLKISRDGKTLVSISNDLVLNIIRDGMLTSYKIDNKDIGFQTHEDFSKLNSYHWGKFILTDGDIIVVAGTTKELSYSEVLLVSLNLNGEILSTLETNSWARDFQLVEEHKQDNDAFHIRNPETPARTLSYGVVGGLIGGVPGAVIGACYGASCAEDSYNASTFFIQSDGKITPIIHAN